MAGFDLGELQAAAAQGREGLKRYREQQTALSGSQADATSMLLQGIATRSGDAAGGQDYTRQVLERAGLRGQTALGSAGDVAGQRQSGTEGQEGWLSALSGAQDARAADTAQKIADAAQLALQRSQGSFDSDLSFKRSESDKDRAAQQAALERLIANQARSFDEAQQLAAAKQAASAAESSAENASKYGGYQTLSEQQAAARGFGVLAQEKVQQSLGRAQHDASFDQDQADRAYAASEWLHSRKTPAAYDPAGPMGPQGDPTGIMGPQGATQQGPTGFGALGPLLAQLQGAVAGRQQTVAGAAIPPPPQAPGVPSATTGQQSAALPYAGPATTSQGDVEGALRSYLQGAGKAFGGMFDQFGESARRGEATNTYKDTTSRNEATMAALAQLLDTPDAVYQQAGGVQAGMAPEVALGTFQMPTPAERLGTEKAKRDQSYWDQYGTTYEDYQGQQSKLATDAKAAAKTQYDEAIGQLTGMDADRLATASGMSKAQINSVISSPTWTKDTGGGTLADVVDVAIQKALGYDENGTQVAGDDAPLAKLLTAKDLDPDTKRLLRALAQKTLGYNPFIKPSAAAGSAFAPLDS